MKLKRRGRIFLSMAQGGALGRESTPHPPSAHQEHVVVIRDEKSIYFCESQNNSTPHLQSFTSSYK